jgi:hypothetical protein
MNWVQLSDLKGTAGGFIEEKSIFAFPTYVILSRDGVVVSSPLSIGSLKAQIDALLSKP